MEWFKGFWLFSVSPLYLMTVTASYLINYRFIKRMLRSRYDDRVTILLVMFYWILLYQVNISLEIYKNVPQELFYGACDFIMTTIMFRSASSKKILVIILQKSVAALASFVILPFVDLYIVSHEFANITLISEIGEVFIVALAAVFLEWFGKKFERFQFQLPWACTAYLFLLSVFVAGMVLNSMDYYLFKQYGGRQKTVGTALSYSLIAAVGMGLIIFSCVYVEHYITRALMEQHQKLQEKHIKTIERDNIAMRRMRHDIRNHLLCLERLLENDKKAEAVDYLRGLTKTVDDFHSTILTGNSYADAILNEKYCSALSEGIDITMQMSFKENLVTSSQDLCMLLGNALDNAIEACCRITNPANPKKIRAWAGVRRAYLVIEICNSTAAPVEISEDGSIVSAKQDFFLHGVGIENMKAAVARSGGSLDFSYADGLFKFCAMLPLSGGELDGGKTLSYHSHQK